VARAVPARTAGLLLVMAVIGFLGARATDDVQAFGLWPAGLATGVLFWTPPRFRPHATAAVAVVAAGTFVGYDRPLGASIAFGLVVALEAALVVVVMTYGRGDNVGLVDEKDLGRYAVSLVVAGCVAGLTVTLVSMADTQPDPFHAGVAVLVAHAASQALLIPFFVPLASHRGVSGRFEVLLQWTLVLGATLLVFVPYASPGTGFMVIPFLGWCALRRPMREAVWQLFVVACVAAMATSLGHGPFARVPNRIFPLPETSILLTQGFVICCAMVVLPLALAVGQQRLMAASASGERERLQRIVRGATGVAIVGTDEVGRINLFNPGAEALLGYRPDEVLGRSPQMFHTAEEVAAQARALGVPADFVTVSLTLAASPEPVRRDWQFIRKDGTLRSASMTITAITDSAGVVTGYVATAEDITHRVQTEHALVAALEAEREAVDRLKSLDRAKDSFVSNVSHELRTPITNIVGFLEMLQDGMYGETSDAQNDALARITQNSHRLLMLIDDLLTLSQAQDQEMHVAFSEVDLRTVVDRVFDLISPSLAARRLRVQVEKPLGPVRMVGDQEKLERMLLNLAGNAVKFTGDGGSVTLRLLARGDTAVLEVADTGMGIPMEDQPRLFNRFFRSSNAEDQAIQGSGLGLSIAHTIAALHGGEVSVQSAVGEGSTFRVSLPMRTPSFAQRRSSDGDLTGARQR
jgi:PAS domain S-box-containing protein